MKKNVLTIVLILIIFVLGFWLAMEKQSEEEGLGSSGDVVSHEQTVGQQYLDEETGLVISYPDEWQDKIKISDKQTAEKRLINLEYMDSTGHEQMIFMINVYPAGHPVYQIASEPNNRMVLVATDHIFSVSQALDMPYMQGSEDFENYSQMMTGMDEVVAGLTIQDGSFARVVRNFSHDEENKYTIDVLYPEFVGVGNFEVANKEVESVVRELIDSFTGQVIDWNEDDMGPGHGSTLNMNFEVAELTDKMVSFRLLISDYFSSAAHPNNRSLSFNYDLETGQEIKIGDLFESDNYLPVLIEEIKVELARQYEEKGLGKWDEIWSEGLTVNEKTVDNFTLQGDKIIFHFDPYEVGPYAAGSFEVKIDK